ncbi:ubiquinol-cytochrome C reductase, iron-sulfur subunit [Ectothiorhodospira haloalkaliphila]|uniref:Ubiquinol-cytochrome C reductase, iron-sulfur subunit n=1 Tax=Ectothiorhodospira haloalkaliphila TaxID=421628 RepID=W8KS29_9GAMM|nr:ubiquinol-cytochrome c reductase iron-sulfur subunit [Ectothiorhodospira haloalkaliphila]AHK79822.1 ubiquinol-cytochrome C reductase, iron-sulfur subunit [Ectothiorhodospira haloalkaliphila]
MMPESFNVPPDQRRIYYRVALKMLALLGVAMLAYVMLSGVLGDPDDDGGQSGGRSVDISDLAPGEVKAMTWEGRPIWIVGRTPEMLEADAAFSDQLYDADSRLSRQPRDYRNSHRSASPEVLVVVALGTDLACELTWVPPEVASEEGWGGGFVDRCRGSRYDLSGRVYRDQHARRNLEVPNYRLLPDDRLILGQTP